MQDLADAAAENKRVGRVARIIEHGTGHRRDAHLVAVVGHAFDDAFLDNGRMQHARGKLVVVEVARAEAKNIGQRDGTRGCGDDIADDTTHAGVGTAEGFDRAGVVVGFGFDGETYAVGEGHDAGIAVEGGNNEWRGHFFGRLAQLPQERSDFAFGRFDAGAETLVRAVIAPRLRDGFQFRIGRIASGFLEPFRHHGHFLRVEGEGAVRIDARQRIGAESAHRNDFHLGGFRSIPAGEAGSDGAERPCFDHRIAQEVVHEEMQIFFRQAAGAGDFETRSGGGFDWHAAARRALGQLHGHAVGHPGASRHFDGQTIRVRRILPAIESRRAGGCIVDQSRHEIVKFGGVRVAAQEINLRCGDGNIRKTQLMRLPGEGAVAMRSGRFDNFGDITHGRQKRR